MENNGIFSMKYKTIKYNVRLEIDENIKLVNLLHYIQRDAEIVKTIFNEIKQPGHVLGHLLTARTEHDHNTRASYLYQLPAAKTKRFSSSFIPYCLRHRY